MNEKVEISGKLLSNYLNNTDFKGKVASIIINQIPGNQEMIEKSLPFLYSIKLPYNIKIDNILPDTEISKIYNEYKDEIEKAYEKDFGELGYEKQAVFKNFDISDPNCKGMNNQIIMTNLAFEDTVNLFVNDSEFIFEEERKKELEDENEEMEE